MALDKTLLILEETDELAIGENDKADETGVRLRVIGTSTGVGVSAGVRGERLFVGGNGGEGGGENIKGEEFAEKDSSSDSIGEVSER